MTREIKPQDVPAMMRSGKLSVGEDGTILEFSDFPEFCDPKIGRLSGFKHGRTVSYFRKPIGDEDLNVEIEEHYYIRFPLPDLKDGDPVIVNKGGEYKRIFHSFDGDGFINCYVEGKCRWSCEGGKTSWGDHWRIPTPQELVEGGYEADYYTKRGISERHMQRDAHND